MKLVYFSFLIMLAGLLDAQEYRVTVKGIPAGKANLSIEQTNADYKVQLTVYPNFLAKAFVNEMREIATGEIVDGRAMPGDYKRQELSGKQLLSVRFSGNEVDVNSEGEKKSFTIDKYAQDPLTQILQIQRDLKAGKVAWGYYTVTDRRQYYSHVKQQERRVDLIQDKKSGDIVTVWFDKSFQLERMRKKSAAKVVFDMKKTSEH